MPVLKFRGLLLFTQSPVPTSEDLCGLYSKLSKPAKIHTYHGSVPRDRSTPFKHERAGRTICNVIDNVID